MKFFTDKTVDNDYLLIKIKDYWNLKRKDFDFSKWKEVFIDPGVYDLTKSDKFKWEGKINIKEFLNSLPDNHYFSFDYPCDMNLEYTNKFLGKTWLNAEKYHNHPNYIVTAQYPFKNYWAFVEWFDDYNDLEIKSGILGLGNMCRFRTLNEYLKHALDYAFSRCNHPRIHIYGLCLKAIPYAIELSKRYGVELSIDSTKWTRACTNELKDKYGRVCCRKETRQEFFDEYKKELESRLYSIWLPSRERKIMELPSRKGNSLEATSLNFCLLVRSKFYFCSRPLLFNLFLFDISNSPLQVGNHNKTKLKIRRKKMSKLQIAMTESELQRIYEVLNKASASFQLKEGKRFNYRSTIVKIVEDYGRTHGLINKRHEVVNGIENSDEDREYFETMISAVEKQPTAGSAKTLWGMVLKLNPKYKPPKEGANKALVIEAKRLLEAGEL